MFCFVFLFHVWHCLDRPVPTNIVCQRSQVIMGVDPLCSTDKINKLKKSWPAYVLKVITGLCPTSTPCMAEKADAKPQVLLQVSDLWVGLSALVEAWCSFLRTRFTTIAKSNTCTWGVYRGATTDATSLGILHSLAVHVPVKCEVFVQAWTIDQGRRYFRQPSSPKGKCVYTP